MRRNLLPQRPFDILADGRPIITLWSTTKRMAIRKFKRHIDKKLYKGFSISASARLHDDELIYQALKSA
jgi:hypothetical protein